MKKDKKTTKEIRIFSHELRVKKGDDEKGGMTIAGYAALFDSLSGNLGGFVEKIAPGAFTEALKNSDARALFNHDPNLLLGRQSAGTLRLKEDEKGLWMETDLPDTPTGNEVATLIERGDLTQQSFGFTISSDTWEDIDKDVAVRTINKVETIFDVSPVVFPAYAETSVAMRSLEQCRQPEEKETPLRNRAKRNLLLKGRK